MDSHESPSIIAALEHKVRSGAGATQIANSVATALRHVEASLTPILGPLGVAALYRRSLLLTSRSHPWLAGLAGSASNTVELAALVAAMAERDSNDVAQAGGDLLQRFYALVDSLIGAALTHRLLGSLSHIV